MTLRIFDLEDRALAFDLRDLLRLLAPLSLQARWTVSSFEDEFEATGEGAVRLEQLANNESSITGNDLAALADNTWQIIWGEFAGVLAGGSDRPWITIRAVDSSFFEVETSDEAAAAKIISHFRDVRMADVAT